MVAGLGVPIFRVFTIVKDLISLLVYIKSSAQISFFFFFDEKM